MKCNFYYLIFIGILLISFPVFAQKTVVTVQPDAGLDIGALNNAISNAADPGNTIFELKKGGLYLLNGSIAFTGYTLHIRAEEGPGLRPVLQPAVDQQGSASRHFNSSGNLTLEGLYLQGRSELGAVIDQPIRVSGKDTKVIINDCFIDYANSTAVRLNTSGNSVFISNSIIRNCLLPDNPDNGRLIDTRSNPTDTISVVNSTIYNGGSRLIRTAGANIKYVELNHNTIYQVSIKENFMLDAIKEAKITNNIFYNFSYRANNTLHDPIFTVDSIGVGGEYTDAERHFNLSNNNFYQQKEIADVFDNFGADTLYRYNAWDSLQLNKIEFRYVINTNLFANKSILDTAVLTPKPVLLNFIENGQVDTTNIFSEMLEFDNAPPLNLDYLKFYVENGYAIGGTNPPNPFADENPDVLGEVSSGAYTFSYLSSTKSATAAEGGKPLGDPRWEIIEDNTSVNNLNSLSTIITYPNPSNGQFTLNYSPKTGKNVTLYVVNMLGKKVFYKEYQNNPSIIEEINLRDLGKGLYFVQIEEDRRVSATSKIMIK